MGLCPNDWQVGQTGKMTPRATPWASPVPFSIPLSGAEDAKTVVAINKDAEAPIFEVADYGLVADGVEALGFARQSTPSKKREFPRLHARPRLAPGCFFLERLKKSR